MEGDTYESICAAQIGLDVLKRIKNREGEHKSGRVGGGRSISKCIVRTSLIISEKITKLNNRLLKFWHSQISVFMLFIKQIFLIPWKDKSVRSLQLYIASLISIDTCCGFLGSDIIFDYMTRMSRICFLLNQNDKKNRNDNDGTWYTEDSGRGTECL